MMTSKISKSRRSGQVLVTLAALVLGCDSRQTATPGSTAEPEDDITAFRKTLPPVPDSLQPLARELEQLYKQQNRPPNTPDEPISRPGLPGALPYRMANGGKMIEINLRFTPVTDDFLKKLAALPDLEAIDVRGTQITDAGLESLNAAPALKNLYLSLTKVTDEGADRFRESHPNCNVQLWRPSK